MTMPENELHFDKAPIAEALMSINVEPLDDEHLLRLLTVEQTLQSDYPNMEPLNQLQIEVGFSVQASGVSHQTSHKGEAFGYKFASADKRQLAVLRRDGFSFSRLPPYERWESFKAEAKRLWNVYRTVAGSARIVSCGLRFINRVSFPVDTDVSDYLRLYPQIPDNRDGTPRIMHSSYLRVESVLQEPPGRQIIQQAMLPPERLGHVTLSLDFDLLFPVEADCEDQVWVTLEAARQLKNDLFIDSLTPTFLETFK